MKKNKIHRFITGVLAGTMLLGIVSVSAAAEEQVTAAPGSAEASSDSESDVLFTEKDLACTPDLSDAVQYAVKGGEDITISESGVYVLSGTAENTVICVEAGDEDKIQLVLDGLSVTNTDAPCIYVKNADKVFVTTMSDSSLTVTGTFTADGDTNTDGAVFSRSDLVLNGMAALTVNSTDNGIVSKDDLKVTGGTYTVTAASKAFEANDSICIADGTFSVSAGTDGFHSENGEDSSLGYIYIEDGTFTVVSGDDAIHANAYIQIESGTFDISAAEGIESTYILINGGTFGIEAGDDGINAAFKSNAYRPALEINGGEITVTMASGDTDGIDSNGDLKITGGSIDVSGPSSFDVDGTVTFTGGTVIVNGQQVDTIPSQMMGRGGGFGGVQGGDFGGMQGGDFGGMQGGDFGGKHAGGMGGMQGRQRWESSYAVPTR